MELREIAHQIVTTPRLAAKLEPIGDDWTDDDPGAPLRIDAPARPPELAIADAREAKVPAIGGMHDPVQRSRIVHSLANHELQATELFAWALLAFADAPREFRRGLAHVLADEQRHTKMYLARLESWSVPFGSYPVTGYFWNKIRSLATPLEFICAMSLTFENANLDHTIEYADAARRWSDPKTAAVIDQIHRDEIEHVRFGWRWLQRFKGADEDPWDAYRRSVTWPLRPALARGERFHREGRESAELDPDFIEKLARSSRTSSADSADAP